jgi:hypothetical protein
MDLILANNQIRLQTISHREHRDKERIFLVAGEGPAIKKRLIAARRKCTAGAAGFQKIALSAIFRKNVLFDLCALERSGRERNVCTIMIPLIIVDCS